VLGDWGMAIPVDDDQSPHAKQLGLLVTLPPTEYWIDGRRDVVMLAECVAALCTNCLRPELTPPR
jgi:hypothetical protein